MSTPNNLLNLWVVQQADVNPADRTVLTNLVCDGSVLYQAPHEPIAYLAHISSSHIRSAIAPPITTQPRYIMLSLSAVMLVLASPWLSPWVNRHISATTLFVVMNLVLLAMFVWLRYEQERQPPYASKYQYQLWLSPKTGVPVLDYALSDVNVVQRLQTWLHQYMPLESMAHRAPDNEVIQLWLAEQHTDLVNFQLLANLRLYHQVLYQEHRELLLLKYMTELTIQTVTGRYQPPEDEYDETNTVMYYWLAWVLVTVFYVSFEGFHTTWLIGFFAWCACAAFTLYRKNYRSTTPLQAQPPSAHEHHILLARTQWERWQFPLPSRMIKTYLRA